MICRNAKCSIFWRLKDLRNDEIMHYIYLAVRFALIRKENSFGEQFYTYKIFLLVHFILLQHLPQILKKELHFFDLLC